MMRQKTTETQKWKNVPQIKNANILFLKTPPRLFCSVAGNVCKEYVAIMMTILHDRTVAPKEA